MCVYRAALGAAEGVSEVIKVVEGEGALDALGIEDDKEEYLYTAFYKSELCVHDLVWHIRGWLWWRVVMFVLHQS